LELIRYIHLNPLRAKLIRDLKGLDKYPWSGHSVLIGKQKNPLISDTVPINNNEKLLAEKTIEDVLKHFGKSLKAARQNYHCFVEKGIKHGRREDLQGGGLIRPACHARHREELNRKTCTQIEERGFKLDKAVKARAGRSSRGDKAGLLGLKKEDREKGDARILGSGDFVVQALKRANELHERSIKSRISLNELIKRVSKDRNIDLKDLRSSKRKKDISNTRAIISYLAAIELRHSGAKIASELRLSEKSVSRCIEREKTG